MQAQPTNDDDDNTDEEATAFYLQVRVRRRARIIDNSRLDVTLSTHQSKFRPYVTLMFPLMHPRNTCAHIQQYANVYLTASPTQHTLA